MECHHRSLKEICNPPKVTIHSCNSLQWKLECMHRCRTSRLTQRHHLCIDFSREHPHACQDT